MLLFGHADRILCDGTFHVTARRSRPRTPYARRRTALITLLFVGGVALGVFAVLLLHHESKSTPAGGASAGSPKTTTSSGLAAASAGVQADRSTTSEAEGSSPTVAGAGSEAATAPPLAPGASASFKRLQAGLAGSIELAVTPVGAGHVETFGGDRVAHGWSTTKVPVLVALLSAKGAQGLTSTEKTWAHAAITASDNQSILDLFGALEQIKGGLAGASEAVEELFRSSGDQDTVVATAPPPPGAVTRFGQTDWRPARAVQFFSALDRGCLIPSAETRYVLGLMQNIVPSESWGLGSGGFDHVAFKGGWGPEGSAYIVRQAGIIDPETPQAVAVSIVAFPPAGSASFSTGTEMLTSTANWLHRELRPAPHPVPPCSTE
jgi:hypothetical protein